MERYVFCVDENTMIDNHKTDNQVTDLLKKMNEYGTIHSYEDYAKLEREESQKVINDLTKKLKDGITLTEGEKSMIMALRNYVNASTAVLKQKNADLIKKFNDFSAIMGGKLQAIGDIIKDQKVED